jgi:sugar/nucleoside kinase (ribokinase family)
VTAAPETALDVLALGEPMIEFNQTMPTVALIRRARILQASGISLAISASACDAVLHAFEAARAAGVQVAIRAMMASG